MPVHKIYTTSSSDWDGLITDVRNENIVPIIGSEAIELYFDSSTFDFDAALRFNPVPIHPGDSLLLWQSRLLIKLKTDYTNKRGFLLYDYLTYKMLAFSFKDDIITDPAIDLTGKIDLNKAAFIFILNTGKDLTKKSAIRNFIKGEIAFLRQNFVSTSLDNLAAIPYFELYVSLTIDTFLKNSVNKYRWLGNPVKDNIVNARSKGKQDFNDSRFTNDAPRIYNIYGVIDDTDSNSYFSITEEEIIENTCKLGVSEHKPDNLLNYLKNKNLLLIGCKYNDWLLGFLLRILTGNRLYDTDLMTKKIFADKSFDSCQTFLTKDYEIYIDNIEAIDFINKLHQDSIPVKGKKIEKGGVFISFHSKDRLCVEELKNILYKNGIPAWYDEDALRSGNDITPLIKDNINTSSVFLACISNHNKMEPGKYFMEEWKYAKKVKSEFRADMIIVPVIIDETIPYNDPFVVEHFPDIKNITLRKQEDQPGQTCTFDENDNNFKKLVSDLRSSVRDYRSKLYEH